MLYVLIAYGLLIAVAVWMFETHMFKYHSGTPIPDSKEPDDPYKDYRDPTTGLLRSRPWKKK